MISRLYHASSTLLVSTRVHHDARLPFSSSVISHSRRLPQRSAGERANLAAVNRRPRENEDEVEDKKFDADEDEEEKQLDRWLLAGEEKVNDSAIRSYKNPYSQFCKNVASSFREPSPRNWLGRDVPFPLNPSFKPPIPLSDELRTRLYRAYMIDPKLNSVRALAARHGISIKRVDAILRLKGMEQAWNKEVSIFIEMFFISHGYHDTHASFVKPKSLRRLTSSRANKPLQTGFTRGMEHLLGVKETTKLTDQDANDLENEHTRENDRSISHNRYDVEEADLQDEVEGNNRARQRYQRLFWESVAEGEEPVMPSVLVAQQSTALARTKFSGKTTLVERASGRPAIMFVDVGNAFVDEKEKERREREGARRSTMKARKRLQDHGLRA